MYSIRNYALVYKKVGSFLLVLLLCKGERIKHIENSMNMSKTTEYDFGNLDREIIFVFISIIRQVACHFLNLKTRF